MISGCGNLGVSIEKNKSFDSTDIIIVGGPGPGGGGTGPDGGRGDEIGGGTDTDNDGDGVPDLSSLLSNLGYADDSCRPQFADGRDTNGDRIGDCVFGYLVRNVAACEAIVGSYLWYCNVEGHQRRFNGWICCGPV